MDNMLNQFIHNLEKNRNEDRNMRYQSFNLTINISN